jgi:hypothetical protein
VSSPISPRAMSSVSAMPRYRTLYSRISLPKSVGSPNRLACAYDDRWRNIAARRCSLDPKAEFYPQLVHLLHQHTQRWRHKTLRKASFICPESPLNLKDA